MGTEEELKAAKDAIDKAREAVAKMEAALKPKYAESDLDAIKDLFGGMGRKP